MFYEVLSKIKNELPKAIENYEKSLEFDPNYLRSIENLGTLYANDKDLNVKVQKALPLLLKAEDLNSTNGGNVYYNIACIFSLQKEIEKAVTYLDKAIYNDYENFLINKMKSQERSFRIRLNYNF